MSAAAIGSWSCQQLAAACRRNSFLPHCEVVALHADRRAQLRRVVEAVTDTGLEQIRTAAPAPAWRVEPHSIGDCLRVVLEEHCAHRRYAVRDLALLETG